MELFDKVDFFGLYKTYVQVIASASSQEKIKDWCVIVSSYTILGVGYNSFDRGGTVESRIRTLVQDLENTDIIVTAHPLIYGIPNTFYCLTEEEQAAASQGELSEAAMRRKESDMEGKEYKKVWTKSFFVGLEIEKKPSRSASCTCFRDGLIKQKTRHNRGYSICSIPVRGSARRARDGTSMMRWR